MRRVGVLGGSFDPVHVGHLQLALRAVDQVPLDQAWLLPAAQPPHKPGRTLTLAAHRLQMLQLAIREWPALRVCTDELERDAVRYSVQTLGDLVQRHPDTGFWFLMGEDSLADLGSWREPQRLVRLAAPVVAPRPRPAASQGSAPPTRASSVFGVPLIWLRGDPIDLASTTLRAALARGERPAGIPSAVLDYIQEHGLYQAADAGSGAP